MVQGVLAVLVHARRGARLPDDFRALHFSVSDDDTAGDHRGPVHDLRRPGVCDHRRLHRWNSVGPVADEFDLLWTQWGERVAESGSEVLMWMSRDERERARTAGPVFARWYFIAYGIAALIGLAIGVVWT